MEWNRIKLQILFALMSRVQDSNILSRKNPSVLYQVQMEAMQFLEEGGAYSYAPEPNTQISSAFPPFAAKRPLPLYL